MKTNKTLLKDKKIKELEKRIEVLEKAQHCHTCLHTIPYIPQPTYYPSVPKCASCGAEIRGNHYCFT